MNEAIEQAVMTNQDRLKIIQSLFSSIWLVITTCSKISLKGQRRKMLVEFALSQLYEWKYSRVHHNLSFAKLAKRQLRTSKQHQKA